MISISFSLAEQGEVYVYYGGSKFPLGKATRGCDTVDPCPGDKVCSTGKMIDP